MTGGILKLEHSKIRKARTALSYEKEIPTTRGGDKCREDHKTVYHQCNKKKNRSKYVGTTSKKGFASVTTAT